MRKAARTTILAVLCSSLVASPVMAGEITDDAAGDELIETLENAAWVKDGSSSDKVAYVVYSPSCPWSRKMFNETRDTDLGGQLRWIPVQGDGVAHVAGKRSLDAIETTFKDQDAGNSGPVGQRLADYNNHVMHSVADQVEPYQKGRFGFPTLIYRTGDGVRVKSGRSGNIASMLQEAAPTPKNRELKPASLEFAQSPVQTTQSESLEEYANTGDAPVDYYGAPTKKAPKVGELKSGYVLPVNGVVQESEWIEVTLGDSGRNAYIHDPQLARLALLDFTVKPASGTVSAKGQAKKIRSHPDGSAPVMSTLDAGHQMRRTGAVTVNGKSWDQIKVYSDGTKGYVRH